MRSDTGTELRCRATARTSGSCALDWTSELHGMPGICRNHDNGLQRSRVTAHRLVPDPMHRGLTADGVAAGLRPCTRANSSARHPPMRRPLEDDMDYSLRMKRVCGRQRGDHWRSAASAIGIQLKLVLQLTASPFRSSWPGFGPSERPSLALIP